MALDPKLARKLMSEIPEMRDFVAFVRREVDRLNDLSALRTVPNEDLIVEHRARERAGKILENVLDPLVSSSEPQSTAGMDEYVT